MLTRSAERPHYTTFRSQGKNNKKSALKRKSNTFKKFTLRIFCAKRKVRSYFYLKQVPLPQSQSMILFCIQLAFLVSVVQRNEDNSAFCILRSAFKQQWLLKLFYLRNVKLSSCLRSSAEQSRFANNSQLF